MNIKQHTDVKYIQPEYFRLEYLNTDSQNEASPIFFFFFQAEDGIRDSSVTGVQTCALPISLSADGRYAESVRIDLSPAGHLRIVHVERESCLHIWTRHAKYSDEILPSENVHRGRRARGHEIGRASCRERV